jgi:hypothetical protein
VKITLILKHLPDRPLLQFPILYPVEMNPYAARGRAGRENRGGCGFATAGSVTRALITLLYIDLED